MAGRRPRAVDPAKGSYETPRERDRCPSRESGHRLAQTHPGRDSQAAHPGKAITCANHTAEAAGAAVPCGDLTRVLSGTWEAEVMCWVHVHPRDGHGAAAAAVPTSHQAQVHKEAVAPDRWG